MTVIPSPDPQVLRMLGLTPQSDDSRVGLPAEVVMQVPQPLAKLVGHEHDIETVSLALRSVTRALKPAAVGAFQIGCSDETEKENTSTFHKVVVRHLLPELKYWSRSSFRSANLGARYEQGAIAIAESHFATPATDDAFKVLLVKLNAHVAVRDGDEQPSYGHMVRYDKDSSCCGAIRAVLNGSDLPFARELDLSFRQGGLDRLAILRDPSQVDPRTQALVAAVCSSRLQMDRLLADLLSCQPASPTLYILTNCVTVNRDGPDTEVLCGCITVDARTDPFTVERMSVGDDPSRIEVIEAGQRLALHER